VPSDAGSANLHQAKPIFPIYAENFRCIGPECEDTCCRDWSVPVDRAAYERFQSLPPSPLRVLIDASIVLLPEGAASSDGFGAEVFAKIGMNEQNQCPLLTTDRLCRVHAEGGEALLPHSCGTYPRLVRSVGGQNEQALALSCPEAARHVLLKPMRLAEMDRTGASEKNAPWVPAYFWEIRRTVLNLVRNHAYPLWQRMFLLSILCRRLDAIAAGEPERSVPAFLRDFEASVVAGRLRKAMEMQPIDRGAQLDVVLRLAGLLLHRSNVTPRFVECINTFTSGIGNSPTATLESLTDRYTRAHDQYFSPFFARHSHIFENYLINTIVRCQFPFGPDGMKQGSVPAMLKEFAMLTAQFALTKGLLIGVAGFYRENLSTAHVVHTVQASSKHFDHYPDFPKMAQELLIECELNGARGMSILLRNSDSAAPRV
jgi:lysine-N-methylase